MGESDAEPEKKKQRVPLVASDNADDNTETETSGSLSHLPTGDHPLKNKLQVLDFNILPENFFVIFYGVRRTGKTHALTCLLEQVKDRFDFAYLFSETALLHKGEEGELDFDMIREEAKFEGYVPEALQRIMDRQRYVKEFNNKCKKKRDRKPNKTLLIFDDFVHDTKIRYDTLFTKLPVLGRHFDLSVVCLSQGYSQVASGGLNKATRQNADLVATFLPRNSKDLENVADWYLCQEKVEAMWFIRSICEGEHAMLGLDLSRPHLTKLAEYAYQYKAPADVPNYELGKVQWKLYREEQRRNRALAKGAQAEQAKEYYVTTDELEIMARINQATGQPEHRSKKSLFDAMMCASVSGGYSGVNNSGFAMGR